MCGALSVAHATSEVASNTMLAPTHLPASLCSPLSHIVLVLSFFCHFCHLFCHTGAPRHSLPSLSRSDHSFPALPHLCSPLAPSALPQDLLVPETRGQGVPTGRVAVGMLGPEPAL